MLCGTLMGLTSSAHAAMLFTFRPPVILQRRIAEERAATVVTFAALFTMSLAVVAGVAGAFAADVLIAEDANFAVVPDSDYLAMVMVAIVIVGLPALFFMRDRWPHVMSELMLALGIYGILMPNVLIALQNRL